MKLWLRILWIYLTYRSRSKLSIEEVSRTNLIVLPNDLDTYGHINNGVYLTIMDLGRLDQGLRTGIWQDWKKRGWYPVVVNATISFRKSLQPWQKYTLETKVIGWDEVAYFIEQRFVRNGEIYAKAIMRGRFLKRSWGTVTPDEVMHAHGGWPGGDPKLPKWVKDWAESVALPKGKEPAPSEWD